MKIKLLETALFCAVCTQGVAAELQNPVIADNKLMINFPSNQGMSYRLLSSTDINTPLFRWLTVTNILGTGDVVTQSVTMNRTQNYYVAVERTNPLYRQSFFVDQTSVAQRWIDSHASDATNVLLMQKLSTQPTGIWLVGQPGDIGRVGQKMALAKSSAQIPVFVIYNIPLRDCGSFSGGGAVSGNEYLAWIEQIVAALQGSPSVVILEPDALANLDCPALSAADRDSRIEYISKAILALKSEPLTTVYVDAGHAAWKPAPTMIALLTTVGATNADGFCLNVSNFESDKTTIAYGEAISKKMGDMHFVIDSSRNGLGPNRDSKLKDPWCNPPGRALGRIPTFDSGHPLIDGFLWVKVPGESDGSCRAGSPAAGVFWPEYALELAKNASF